MVMKCIVFLETYDIFYVDIVKFPYKKVMIVLIRDIYSVTLNSK